MPRNDKKIDAVIFDMDDTLIDWRNQTKHWLEIHEPKVGRAYHYLQTAGHEVPVSQAEFFQMFSHHSENSWRSAKDNGWRSPNFLDVMRSALLQAGMVADEVDMTALLKAYDWGVVEGVTIFPDTIPVLKELKQRGYKVGLVTNAYFPMWMRQPELDYFAFGEYLDEAITSGETGWLKPHPAVFWRMLGLLKTMPERAVFVGDSPQHDIAGANDVGMHSVFHFPAGLERHLDDIRPDHTVERMTELLPILDELEK